MISSLLWLATSTVLCVLAMYGGRGQGLHGEQSGGDDHTGRVSGIHHDQARRYGSDRSDSIRQQSVSPGSTTHVGQHPDTGYVAAPSDVYHVTHTSQYQGEVSHLNRFQQSNEGLSLEEELEYINSSKSEEEIADLEASIASLFDPPSSSNRFQEIHEMVGLDQRGGTRRDIFPPPTLFAEPGLETVSSLKSIEALDGENIIQSQHSPSQTTWHEDDGESTHVANLTSEQHFDPNSFLCQYLSDGATNDQSGNSRGLSADNFANPTRMYSADLSSQPVRPKKRIRLSESTSMGYFQGSPEPSSSSQSHLATGCHQSDRILETQRSEHSGHPEEISASPTLVDLGYQPVHQSFRLDDIMQLRQSLSSDLMTHLSQHQVNDAHGQSSDQRQIRSGNPTHGRHNDQHMSTRYHEGHLELPAISPAGNYQYTCTHQSTTNSGPEDNTNFPGIILRSSGVPVSGSISSESNTEQYNVLEPLFIDGANCIDAKPGDITYSVCLTDSWSKLTVSAIIPSSITSTVICEFKNISSSTELRRRSQFVFPCSLEPRNIVALRVTLVRFGSHFLSVGGTNVQLDIKGWLPETVPFITTNSHRGRALCGAIPLFRGSIGFVALKKELGSNSSDMPTRGILASLPESGETSNGQFDVLISNSSTHLLYRGIASSSSSSSAPSPQYSVVVKESINQLIVTSLKGETKAIKLVNCKQLAADVPIPDIHDAMKSIHSSIVRTLMIHDMVTPIIYD